MEQAIQQKKLLQHLEIKRGKKRKDEKTFRDRGSGLVGLNENEKN